MSDLARIELALRRVGELALNHGDRIRGNLLGEAAGALVLLTDLPTETAAMIVDDYVLAGSLRHRGPPPRHRRRRQGDRPSQKLASEPPVVIGIDQTVELPDGPAQISGVVFTSGRCEVAVHYPQSPTWHQTQRRGYSRAPGPGQARQPLPITDDQGTTASAQFSGSGDDDGWDGRWTTEDRLSATTKWLDLGTVRLDLSEPSTPLTTSVEQLPDEPLVHRLLWQRLATTERHHPIDEGLIPLLIDVGLLAADDPVIEELEAVAASFMGTPSPGLKPPWQSVLTRSRRVGPEGRMALAAATPTFEGTVVLLSGMSSTPDMFSLQARVMGELVPWISHLWPGIEGPSMAWWASDDRGNDYRGTWGNSGSGDGEVTGGVDFEPPLDSRARLLTVKPTGLRERALIEIPLPPWGSA